MKLNTLALLTNLLLLVLVLPIDSFGQKELPGGVAGLQHWFTISSSTEQGQSWSDQVGGANLSGALSEDQFGILNGHPVLRLAKNEGALSWPVTSSLLNKSTIVSLYQAQDTFQEQLIWRVAKPNEPGLVLSTQRLGDVSKGRYFNTSNRQVLHPVLHTYVQHDRAKANAAVAQWYIGDAGDMDNLPIVSFEGFLPELLVYNRVLTPGEQLQVNSHLAIQYGISLPKSNYLDASGQVIWNFEENQEFPHHIAGLIHDPVSGLHQKQSGSQMTTTPLIELSAGSWASTNAENKAEIPAGVSLIWGDNGGRLRFLENEHQQVSPPRLERKWLVEVSQGGSQLPTELRLHARNLERLLKPSEEIWLAVDESGTGQFAYADTKYYPARREGREVLTFTELHWDPDQSGKDAFSFVLGKPMLSVIGVEHPQCSPDKEAALHLSIYGGKAPYKVRWMRKGTGQMQSWQMENGQEYRWTERRTGFFELQIIDVEGEEVHRAISLQNQDAPVISLLPKYTIPAGKPLVLTLDGASETFSSIQWTNAAGSLTRTSIFTTTKPGDYQVRVEANGCAREHRFQVLAAPTHFLEDWQLFPNPIAVNEDFELRFSLHQPQAITISLMDGSGRVISSEKRMSAGFHSYMNRINSPGLYQIVLRNESDQAALPIVVQ